MTGDVAQCKKTQGSNLLTQPRQPYCFFLSKPVHFLIFRYVFIPTATSGQGDNQRNKPDPALLLVRCFHIYCFSDSFTDGAGLCPLYYEPCKIFSATESLIHISFHSRSCNCTSQKCMSVWGKVCNNLIYIHAQ